MLNSIIEEAKTIFQDIGFSIYCLFELWDRTGINSWKRRQKKEKENLNASKQSSKQCRSWWLHQPYTFSYFATKPSKMTRHNSAQIFQIGGTLYFFLTNAFRYYIIRVFRDFIKKIKSNLNLFLFLYRPSLNLL